jgi:DNA-binding response OmpR family regulator
VSPRPGSLASRIDGPGDGPTVLVVEDEPDIAAFLGAFFRASGTALVHIDPHRPSEVVDAAVEHKAACMLLDLRLDRLSGLDVLSAVREDPRLADLPVIVVSADDRDATRSEAIDRGASAYVTKPFNVKELFAQVHRLLDGDGADPAGGGTGGVAARSGYRLLRHDELQARIDAAVAQSRKKGSPIALGLIRVRDGGREPAFGVVSGSARTLQDHLAPDAVVGCSGPDEVAVLLRPDDGDVDAVGKAASSLGGALTATIGVALFPDHAADGDELYMAADAALTEATERGLPLVRAQ